MALPFIVGPHQCHLIHGPDGRPQVEVVFRLRLPLAEFFDALLLSLADQRPLFPLSESGTVAAPPGLTKKGQQPIGQPGLLPRETAAASRVPARGAQPKGSSPKVPKRSTEHPPKIDPTHEKLLAALSQAQSAADPCADMPTTSDRRAPTPNSVEGGKNVPSMPRPNLPDSQATGSNSKGQRSPEGHAQSTTDDASTREHVPPHRAFAHPKKCPAQ